MALCIAVIDDDPACGDLFHEVLSEEGYAVHLFSDGATAVQVLQALAPAAIIVDLRLEHHTAGWEVLTYLQHAPVLQTTPLDS